MPFIPHTADDINKMLAEINIAHINQCFDEVPPGIPQAQLNNIPAGLNELAMSRLMQQRQPILHPGTCFIGAGAYEHYIPAASWDLLSRGEYYTAYTPYQAEASQGSLQLIYEFQTMIANLMAMDVANASLYEGASALAEAVLMAVRIKRSRAKRILVPKNIHPRYRQVLQSILQYQDIVIEALPYDKKTGQVSLDKLKNSGEEDLAAVIVPQPNFFGVLEEVDELTAVTHQLKALVIALVNPIAMSLLKPPGQWGTQGADIACGEGQPLGVPLSSGGPYYGFLCCKEEYIRQLPGRIVGRTTDTMGRDGYTLTLQAREQHIRRAKATSNICTNQGLMVVASTIYMSLLGAEGLRSVAAASHHHANILCDYLTALDGVTKVFPSAFFHEFVLRFRQPVNSVLAKLRHMGIQGGFALENDYPELTNSLLICATETKTSDDLKRYQQILTQCMND